jgi:hypothetical protein
VQELRLASRTLRLAERELEEAAALTSNRLRRGSGLIAEAQQVGILPLQLDFDDFNSILVNLRSAMEWRPVGISEEVDDQVPGLQEEIRQLRADLRRRQESSDAAVAYSREAAGYSVEGSEQVARLEAIDLFPDSGAIQTCPLCSSQLNSEVPEVTAIRRNLENLRASLNTVERERPRLREYLGQLDAEKAQIKEEIADRQNRINSITALNAAAEEIREQQTTIARTVGRISLYLESVQETEDNSALHRKVASARDRVMSLQSLLAEDEVEDLLASSLSRVSLRMSELAKQLEMEHGEWPFRLDIRGLTVVADRIGAPIPMNRMGGGKNQLGCHLIALFALHEHFIMAGRPVPGVLVLDQPSQVYFPSEATCKSLKGTEEETESADVDIEAVRSMFSLFAKMCESLSPNLQVIVIEHANLREPLFQESLVEAPWTGEDDRALVPEDWE